MSISKKVDFVVILEVKHANPNGDPLNGNRPRMDYDGIGEISDVCIKRKIRDRFLENGENILVRPKDPLKSIKNRVDSVLDLSLPEADIVKQACSTWIDTRAFGQLMAYSGNKKGESAVSIGIKGCVSLSPAYSLEPINVSSTQIVKSVNGQGDDDSKGSDTMGMKHTVDHGIYVFSGAVNHQLSTKTGFSDEDVAKFKEVLPKMFENDASSARPEGSMGVLKVLWWEHNCAAGDCSSKKIIDNTIINSDGTYIFKKDLGVPFEEIEGF